MDFHVGYSTGEYFRNHGTTYFDYAVGIGYTVSNFSIGMKYLGTSLKDGDAWFSANDLNDTESRFVFMFVTTFPWSND